MTATVSSLEQRTRKLVGVVLALLLAAIALPAHSAGVSWRLPQVHFGVSWQRPARAGAVDPAVASSTAAHVRVVVQGLPGHEADAKAAVKAAGGTVGADLPIVNGFAATMSPKAATKVAGSAPVVAITLDRTGHFEQFSFDDTTTASAFTKSTGATQAWSQNKLGDGVGVAVIDTGVSPMNDLQGRVVSGPDLSGEGTLIDTYGHGTVMAGIIGGSGADSVNNKNGAYTGVAPHATVVAVKVAGRNGAVDVSTVLQAMHWVSAYQSQFSIRVLNLSYGTPSTQDPAVDPLNYAVERLWRQGITVVVAAGNSGPNAGTILKPGDDPVALTVGAYDDKQDLNTSNDSVPKWSSVGPTSAGLTKPDVVAPGRTLIAPRSFGSAVEQENPKALIAPSYIKGSGTSEATAVVSGLVALLVQAHPDWTPDQLKAALKGTASPIPTELVTSQGAGRVSLPAALTANPGPAVQQASANTGLGSIEGSRGGIDVQTDCGNDGTVDVIRGEIDVRCEPWSGSAWTGSAWTGSAWTGSAWTGSAWTGSAWTGSAWTGSAWTGSAWTGGTWTGSAWTGSAWTGSAWTGSAWTGSAWTGSAWTGSAWTGSAWTGSAWTSAVYEDDTTTTFLTAFWGSHPKWNKHVAGEVSDDPPAHGPGFKV